MKLKQFYKIVFWLKILSFIVFSYNEHFYNRYLINDILVSQYLTLCRNLQGYLYALSCFCNCAIKLKLNFPKSPSLKPGSVQHLDKYLELIPKT